ncbi:MAG: type II secretion system major pseudopilin GspG [Victivallales bacterium]|nr:type II secretion system major pseudopilin GspG [Victivallales bacterium]
MENRRRNRTLHHPFTLIEIMIVVVIIGMLAALVGPRIIGSLDKARVSTTKTQLVNLKGAVQQFYMDCAEYPNTLDDLMVKTSNAKWSGPYLDGKNLPKDGWDNDFVYTVPGADDQPFDIISYGADKTAGGEDFNADISCWN